MRQVNQSKMHAYSHLELSEMTALQGKPVDKTERQDEKDLCELSKAGPSSSLVSRNITVLGHRTSVRLEPEMWSAIKDISRRERCTVHELCSLIQLRKLEITSLTAAIRVFIMLYYRAAATEEGHTRVGHGCFNSMKRRAKILEDIEATKIKMPIVRTANGGVSDQAQDIFRGLN